MARPILHEISSLICEEIQTNLDTSFEASFITSDADESRFIQSRFTEPVVFEMADYFQQHWDEFTFKAFVDYENKYNCAPLWKLVYADRFLVNRDYDYVVHVVAGFFSFFEMIFKTRGYDFYYDEVVATLCSYVAKVVCEHYGTGYISQTHARNLDATHHYFLRDEYQMNYRMEGDYLSQDYSDDELRRASDLLLSFEEKGETPAYLKRVAGKPKFARLLRSLIAYPINRCRPKWNNPYVYMHYKAYERTLDPLRFYMRYHRSKRIYQTPDLSQKYVYYPLHYQPESSTCVCAEKYEKQLFFIDSWAKSLPADTLLYVKEHYVVLGNRPFSFYKELQHYPNVVLVDPFADSRVLIEGAQAVTTLTGTAGWEAMLLRKPVILGGHIFFDNAPGIMRVDDIYGRYISLRAQWVQPTRDEIVRYLCGYIRSLDEGCAVFDRECLGEDNIRLLAQSLYAEMQRLQAG